VVYIITIRRYTNNAAAINKSHCYSWCSCTFRYRSSKGKGFFVLRQHDARGIVELGVKFHAFLVTLLNDSDSASITEMSTRGKGGRCLGLTSPLCADCLEIQGSSRACPAVTGWLYRYMVEVTRIKSRQPINIRLGLKVAEKQFLPVPGTSTVTLQLLINTLMRQA
jgi:hypothetical protein